MARQELRRVKMKSDLIKANLAANRLRLLRRVRMDANVDELEKKLKWQTQNNLGKKVGALMTLFPIFEMQN